MSARSFLSYKCLNWYNWSRDYFDYCSDFIIRLICFGKYSTALAVIKLFIWVQKSIDYRTVLAQLLSSSAFQSSVHDVNSYWPLLDLLPDAFFHYPKATFLISLFPTLFFLVDALFFEFIMFLPREFILNFSFSVSMTEVHVKAMWLFIVMLHTFIKTIFCFPIIVLELDCFVKFRRVTLGFQVIPSLLFRQRFGSLQN